MTRLRLGSRGSPLALWQARHVRERLRAAWPGLDPEIIEISTVGDRRTDRPLHEIGAEGAFTKEIEEALYERRIDLAVHSCKDLPTELPPSLLLCTVMERGHGGDVLIAESGTRLAELPPGAVLATGSLRRRAQLLNHRPDLSIVDLRGNLNTRFRKFEESDWAGMILAEAGVVRLGLEARISERIPPEVLLPAVGQGALALEIRADDGETGRLCTPLAHPATSLAVRAERAFLHRLHGGCRVPVGALGRLCDQRLTLEGVVASLDGRACLRARREGDAGSPEELGSALAEELLQRGARRILDEIRAG